MGKKSSPPAPDYRGAAEETAKGDKEMLEEQIKSNRPNQYNPWGSLEWSQDDEGNWSQRQTLTPEAQAALDSQLALQRGKSDLASGMLGRMQDEYKNPMDWSDFGDPIQMPSSNPALRQKAEDAAYERAVSRLDPKFEQGRESLAVQLGNRGLSVGDEAYDKAVRNFDMAENDAYSGAQNFAVQQGRQEAAQEYDQNYRSTMLSNQLRQNQIREEMQKRASSLNEINAIMYGNQVSSPSFEGFSQADRGMSPDYAGAAQQQSNYDQMQRQQQQSGFFDLIGAGIGIGGLF